MKELSMADIAKKAGVSYSRVYQLRKQLGRVPTIDEVKNRKGKLGRPTDENLKSSAIRFIENPNRQKIVLEHLAEKHGRNATLGEIIDGG